MIIETDEKYARLISHVKDVFSLAKADRLPYEQQWAKNFGQFRGTYESTVKIQEGRSKVYPRDTRVKVEGFVAKMMELMFPASETNFSLQASPVPDIPPEDLQKVVMMFMQKTQRRPTPDEMMQLVKDFSDTRAEAMTKECVDQLQEIDWTQKCKLALRSGACYGLGVMRGPDVIFKNRRFYIYDPLTNAPYSQTEEVARPFYEALSIWRCYPDFSATAWEAQQFFFEEIVMTRAALYALARRKDFRGTVIKDYLREHIDGNYTPREIDYALRNIAKEQWNTLPRSRQYMVRRFVGFVPAGKLRDMPTMRNLPDDDMETVFIEHWELDDLTIKAQTPPFGEMPSDLYHGFCYLADEYTPICGVGMPENLRDSQLSLCAMSRALMDNIATTAGPVIEANVDLLRPGQMEKKVHSFQTFYREGRGADASIPALRPISIDSHIPELLATIKYQREVLDAESMLPSWLMGQTQQLGEAFRTTNNMSTMQGGANLFAKDVVRSFDNFIKSIVTSLYNWNMKFNDKPDIKGDYDVIPRGTISLLAREVRGQALDQLFMTLTPQERALIDTRKALLERIKSRDLPTNIVLDEQAAAAVQAQTDAAQAQQVQAEAQVEQAKAMNLTASAAKYAAEAMQIGAMGPIEAQVQASDARARSVDSAAKLIGAIGSTRGPSSAE